MSLGAGQRRRRRGGRARRAHGGARAAVRGDVGRARAAGHGADEDLVSKRGAERRRAALSASERRRSSLD